MKTDKGLRLRARYRREYPRYAPHGETEETVVVPVESAALILVDVYPREGLEAEVVTSAIVPLKAAARRAGIPTVYVTNHLDDSTDEFSEWRNVWLRTLGADVLETWAEPSSALAYLPEIAPDAADVVVHKQHYSGFNGTELDELLRRMGARSLFLAGFDARICVAATATDALTRNYRVFVVRDAVATTEVDDIDGGQSAHQHALRYIEACVGYTITVDEFVAACDRTDVT